MVARALAVVLPVALASCSGRAASPAPLAPATIVDAAPPADAPPPDAALLRTYADERVGEMIADVERYGDELCVCRDEGCVEALVEKNRATHEQLLVPLTDEETERLADADARFTSCHLRVTGAYPR